MKVFIALCLVYFTLQLRILTLNVDYKRVEASGVFQRFGNIDLEDVVKAIRNKDVEFFSIPEIKQEHALKLSRSLDYDFVFVPLGDEERNQGNAIFFQRSNDTVLLGSKKVSLPGKTVKHQFLISSFRHRLPSCNAEILFDIISAQFDRNERSQLESAIIMETAIQESKSHFSILSGELNSLPQRTSIRLLKSKGWIDSNDLLTSPSKKTESQSDYIFFRVLNEEVFSSKNLRVAIQSAEIVDDLKNVRHDSNHFPLFVDFELCVPSTPPTPTQRGDETPKEKKPSIIINTNSNPVKTIASVYEEKQVVEEEERTIHLFERKQARRFWKNLYMVLFLIWVIVKFIYTLIFLESEKGRLFDYFRPNFVNFIMGLNYGGILTLPLWIFFTDILDEFRMGLSPPFRLGAFIVMASNLVFFVRIHYDLVETKSLVANQFESPVGVFQYIRFPLYTFLIVWALLQGVLVDNLVLLWFGVFSALVTTVLVVRNEEERKKRKHGREYEMYILKTNLLIPKIY